MAALCGVEGGVGGGGGGVNGGGGGFDCPHGQRRQDREQPTGDDTKLYLLLTVGRSVVQWELECH